ncbi:MAG: methyltransferase domain-containing protein [Deltaproteobacteria bacterium]|nr:methyltransferase domain-containing protein [Deltaproteobacteria bacterium]
MPSCFAAFGAIAAAIDDPTLAVCRRHFHRDSAPAIVTDVAAKLALQPTDTLLDIGCGSGSLLLPLAARVREVWGIDHANFITRFLAPLAPNHCHLLSGDWLRYDGPLPTVDAALCYSVVQYFRSRTEVQRGIDRALTCLRPGGRLLIGDIPNRSRMARFRRTPAYTSVQAEYEAHRATPLCDEQQRDLLWQQHHGRTVTFTDRCILQLLRIYRRRGHDAFILPQPPQLPFGHTREDLLIIKGSR